MDINVYCPTKIESSDKNTSSNQDCHTVFETVISGGKRWQLLGHLVKGEEGEPAN